MLDHVIPKPASVGPYDLHRIVEGLTKGERPQFYDAGDHLIVRSNAELTKDGKQLPEVKLGDMRVFQLRAPCFVQNKRKRHYFPLEDWRSRDDWLRKRARGFEILQLHSTAKSIKIKTGMMDQTDFTGVLKVTDVDQFKETLKSGVSGCPKAFGFGMLVIQ
jgi:hypothetical protein